MQQNINKLTKNEKKFLLVILDDSSLSDTEISKRIGVSKATSSRIRKKIERDFISEYLPIIELDKVGVEIFVVLMFQWNAFNNKEVTKKTFAAIKEDPRTIFLAIGGGSTMNTVVFLGFKNIIEYHEYFRKFRNKYDKFINNVNSLILPSREVIKNDFTEIIKFILRGKNEK